MVRANKAEGDPATGADQRAAPRFTLLLRTAKLVSEAGEFLCILRDASASGIRARLFHPLPDTAAFQLELGNGERFPLEPVWQRDGHAGFRFADGPVDLDGLLEEAGLLPKRMIRLRMEFPLTLTCEGIARMVGLRDLSQQGALIESRPTLALGALVRIGLADLPVRHARVRWRRNALHGLVFQQAFRLDELAALAARLQLGGAGDQDTGRESQIGSRVNQ